MSVLGSMSRKDRAPAVLPNLQQPPDTTGFFQNVGAGFEAAKAGPHSTRNARAIYESRYYDQITQALAAEGERATDYVESPVRRDSPFYRPVEGEEVRPDGRVFVPSKRNFANPFSEAPSLTREVNPLANFYLGGDAAEMNQIWQAVSRVRQRKPDFLKDLPNPQALDALASKQRQADLARAQDVTSRGTTLGKVGAFIGGAAGSVASGDPENLVGGGFATAPGKSIARTVLKRAVEGGAVNAAAGTAALPGQEADLEREGQQPMTVGEMARSVGENALVGAVFGTAHTAVPAAVGAAARAGTKVADTIAENLPAPVRDPIIAASIRAGTVKDRDLLHEFQRLHQPYAAVDTSTPTEKAAAHTVVRDIETQEQSPLQPEAAPHNDQRFATVAKALGVDLTPPDMPTTAPVQTPTVRDHSANAPAPRRAASYEEAVHQAEGTGKNPESSAEGHFQFTKGTWLEYAPKVTDTKGMSEAQILGLRSNLDIATRAEQRFRADNGAYLRGHGEEDSSGNLSLAHFLGKGDAVNVLRAAERDPSTSVREVIDPRSYAANEKDVFSKHQTVGDVIAWAHKRIGTAVDHPPARPDAVPDEGPDYTSPVPYQVETLKPDEVTTDAALMQYKSGGDESGVTDALKGVEAWNPLLSQQILVWEPKDGGRVVVDGHQRVGLAKRLDDPSIELPAIVVREADGITAAQARTLGALRNIANGTGTLLDNAKVLRDAPDAASLLPRNAPLARDSMGLARLSYEAFGAAVNEVVDPRIAAQVGLNAPEAAHMPIIDLLRKERITDPKEAAMIARQAVADGFGAPDVEQLSLLGNEPQQSLYVPIARITAAAAKRLREEKRTFKVLTEKSSKIEAAGNVLDKTANASKVIGNDEALAILDRTAHSAGPVRDALIAAARAELSGARRADAVDRFLNDLAGIDLRAAAAGVGSDGRFSEPSGGAGRDFATEAEIADLPPGSQPGLFDSAIAAREAAETFSDPVAPEAMNQTALLEHDLREAEPEKTGAAGHPVPPIAPETLKKIMGEKDAEAVDQPNPHIFDLASAGFRLSEEGEKPVSLKDALDAADAEEAAAKALRDCL
jgi:hypothetical protein